MDVLIQKFFSVRFRRIKNKKHTFENRTDREDTRNAHLMRDVIKNRTKNAGVGQYPLMNLLDVEIADGIGLELQKGRDHHGASWNLHHI